MPRFLAHCYLASVFASVTAPASGRDATITRLRPQHRRNLRRTDLFDRHLYDEPEDAPLPDDGSIPVDDVPFSFFESDPDPIPEPIPLEVSPYEEIVDKKTMAGIPLMEDDSVDISGGQSRVAATLGTFLPLACNVNVDVASCTGKISSVVPSSKIAATQVTVPCGQCWIWDLEGEVELNGGLLVAGKLVFPSDSATTIKTTHVIVEGVLEITSNAKYISPDFENVRLVLVGDSDVTFTRSDGPDKGICDGQPNNRCNLGKKPFVVLGGKLDIRAPLPGACKHMTPVLDKVYKDPYHDSDDFFLYEEFPEECPSDHPLVLINETFSDGIGLCSGTKGTVADYDAQAGALVVSNRNFLHQGPFLDYTPLDPWKCLLPNTDYLFFARIKLDKDDGSENGAPTSCSLNGSYCPRLISDIGLVDDNNQLKHYYREKKRINQGNARNYGEWFDFTGTITFPKEELAYRGAWFALLIDEVQANVTVSLDHLSLSLPGASSYPNPESPCKDLIFNGDAEGNGYNPYPFRLADNRQSLTVESEPFFSKTGPNRINKFFRLSKRVNHWNTIDYILDQACLDWGVTYTASFNIRIHSKSIPINTIFYFHGHRLSGGHYNRYFLTCPEQVLSDGWVTCAGDFVVNKEMTESHWVRLRFYLSNDQGIYDVDLDDISITYKRGYVDQLVVAKNATACWGQESNVHITSSLLHSFQSHSDRDGYRGAINATMPTGDGNMVITLDKVLEEPVNTIREDPDGAAEIALLSRNVVIMGADDENNENYGGYLQVLHTPVVQTIQGMAFENMGRRKEADRFALQLLYCGSIVGTLLSDNVIVESNQRGIVLEGTSNVTVAKNVLYRTLGYGVYSGYFATDNTYRSNLVSETMYIHDHSPDRYARAFQFFQQPNHVIRNIAVATYYDGFMMNQEQYLYREDGSRVEHTESGNPRTFGLGDFVGNVAKSSGHTGFAFQHFHQYEMLTIYNTRSIRNNHNGIYAYSSRHLDFDGGIMVENRRGVWPRWTDNIALTNFRIVGLTDLTRYNTAPDYYYSRCRDGWPYYGNPVGYDSMTQIHWWNGHQGMTRNRGAVLTNVKFSNFDLGDECKDSRDISFSMTDKRNKSVWNYATTFQKVLFSNHGEVLSNAVEVAQDGFVPQIVIVDLNGSSDPAGLSNTDSAFVSNTVAMRKFAYGKCTDYEGLAYCEDMCPRTVVFEVDQFITQNSLMVVTREDDDQKNVISSFYEHDENEYQKGYINQFRTYSVSLPRGNYKVEFLNMVTQEMQWPIGIFQKWEAIPGCNGYANATKVEVPEPALKDGECDELFRNGDAEQGVNHWIWTGGTLKVLEGQGIDGSNAMGLVNFRHALGQFLDVRCFHHKNYHHTAFEISIYFKLEEDGTTVNCDPFNGSTNTQNQCPFVRLRMTSYQNPVLKEEMKHDYRWSQAQAVMEQNMVENDFHLIHGTFRIDEIIHMSQQMLLYVEGPNHEQDILMDNASVRPIDTLGVCEGNIIRNGDFSTSDTRFWRRSDRPTALDVLDLEVQGLTEKVLKVHNRPNHNTIWSDIFAHCLNEGDRYVIRFYSRYERITTGESERCDFYATSGELECPHFNMHARSDANQEWRRITNVAMVHDSMYTGWDMAVGVVTMNESYANNNHLRLYGNHAPEVMNVYLKDFSMERIPFDCNELVLNSDFEDGTTSFWLPGTRSITNFEPVSPGADGSKFSFMLHRPNRYWASHQYLDSRCFVSGQKYLITAQFRLLNAEDDSGFTCIPGDKSHGDEHCPTVRVRGYGCTSADQDLFFWNEIPFATWDPDGFNAFQADLDITDEMSTCSHVYVEVGQYVREYLKLIVDDLKISARTTMAPTKAPTYTPTGEETVVPTVVPTEATEAPTTSAIAPPPVDDKLEMDAGPTMIEFAPVGTLSMVTKEVYDKFGKIMATVPIARSYDGNVWEPAAGEFAAKLFYDGGIHCYTNGCQLSVPRGGRMSRRRAIGAPHSKGEASERYFLSSFAYSTSGRNELARFLESTTFGTTTEELDALEEVDGGSTIDKISDWVSDQMDLSVVPMTSHREFWRKRTNPRLSEPFQMGSKDHPCTAASKWRSYTFDRDDQQWGDARLTVSGDDPLTLYFYDQVRTVVPKSDFRVLNQGYSDYDFSTTFEYRPCGGYQEVVGGYIGFISENGVCLYVQNPPINFPSEYVNPASYVVNLNTTDNILHPIDMDGPFLNGYVTTKALDDPVCDTIPLEIEGKVFGILPDGSWLQYEPRLQLAENTIAKPLRDGGEATTIKTDKKTTCANAPRTFLNEDQCVLSKSACRFSSSSSDFTLTLMDKTIQELYNLTGRYINGINGLPVADKINALLHPCASPGMRSRWERHDVSKCDETSMGIGTNFTLTSLLRDSGDSNAFIRDIYSPEMGMECNVTDFDFPEIELIVDNDCWRRVHPDYLSIYDMTYWSTIHPGGEYNIKKWAETGQTFLFYPSVHPHEPHPIYRWEQRKHKFPLLGRYGDTIKLIDLSPVGLLTDEVVQYYTEQSGRDSSGVLVCGSPGEAENDKSLGHVFDAEGSQTGEYDRSLTRKFVWLMVVLKANDQLRQRVAWALCQVLVVVKDAIGNENDRTEWFLHYYDIFVRHAFGNYRDILKEISYSPLMAENLSFLQSKSSAYVWEVFRIKAYADENFAREIMQLFTMGIIKLHMDGTPKLDYRGEKILAYTNDDIMSFSRAWTGFDLQATRGNIESENRLDPMRIEAAWRDIFPKTSIDGGYIGDTYPLCGDFPRDHFLKEGATYRFLGNSPLPQLMSDPSQFSTENVVRVVLDDNSKLRDALCRPNKNGKCRHQNSVHLKQMVKCTGIECDLEHLRVVQVAPGAYYEFVHPPCIQQMFYNNAVKLSPRNGKSPSVCTNSDLAVATAACCVQGSNRASRSSQYDGERVSLSVAKQRCQDMDMKMCNFNEIVGHHYLSSNYFWTDNACLLRIKINSAGSVALVHHPSAFTSKVLHVNDDSANWFPVEWDGDGLYPTALNGCDGICDVIVEEAACLCGTVVVSSRVFTRTPRSWAEALAKLTVGAPDPNVYSEGEYSASMNEETGIIVYTKGGVFDSETILEFDGDRGRRYRMKNLKETVQVRGLNGKFSGYSFRNVPQFMSTIPSEATVRDAQYETEAVLDNYFYNDNMAPFIVIRMIQRLVISNPSPQYVHRAATAFTNGSYTHNGKTFGMGKYGDMAATIAAVLLDREARTMTLERDPSHGSLREPLLKFVSILRSMEFVSKRPQVAVSGISTDIGQMAHEFGSVFSFFLPEFQPFGRVVNAGLVAPEATLLDMPKIIGLMNGMFSLVKYGLYNNDAGFGYHWYNANSPYGTGILEYNKTMDEKDPAFSHETFEGRSMRGGMDNLWTGYNWGPHTGRIVVDPHDKNNHVLTMEREEEFNGFIYKFRYNSMNWAQHEAAAVAWGGHLASVHSQEESTFLSNTVVNVQWSYWLGGMRIEENINATDRGAKAWKWSDGTPWDYTRWRANEPNSLGETRLHIPGWSDNEWNDINLWSSMYAIYKKPVASTPAALISSSSQFISPVFKQDVNASSPYVVKFRYLSKSNTATGGCIGFRADGGTPYLNIFQLCEDDNNGSNSMVSDGVWITCKFDLPTNIPEFRIGIADRSAGPSGFYFDDIQVVHDAEHGTGPTCENVILDKMPPQGIDGFSDSLVKELSTLLTAGRLDSESITIIKKAYDDAPTHDEGLRAAQRLILTTAEFHSTNVVERTNILRESFSFPKPSDKSYKALVTVMLNGGCDTFNMLVPYSCTIGKDLQAEYIRIRQAVAIPRDGLNPINVKNQVCETFGVHNSLPIVRDMYEDGDLLFFTNAGVLTREVDKQNFGILTKTQLFAHNTMQQESKRIDPNDLISGTGFLGRMADALTQNGRRVGSFSLDRFHVALIGIPGISDSPMIVNRNGIAQVYMPDDVVATVETLHNVTESDSGFFAETWSTSLMDSLGTNKLLANELRNVETTNEFPMSHLGQQFQTVSKLIATRRQRGVDTDLFYVEIGGFDTHSNVETALNNLFGQINLATEAFRNELKSMNVWQNVTTIHVSDFARTLNPNSGAGTDHAWGGNYMMFGGGVQGGKLVGEYPNDLTDDGPLMLSRGRAIPEISWDAIFLALGTWMGVKDSQVDSVCPNCYQFLPSHFMNPADLFGELPPPEPTATPTSSEPTDSPSFSPSHSPSKSFAPSSIPSVGKTEKPTLRPSLMPSLQPSKRPIEPCVDDKKYTSKVKIDGSTVRKTCKKMKLKKKKNRELFCNLVDKVTKEPVHKSCKAGCKACN